MTEAEAKQRLLQARRNVQRFRRLQNLWRRLVKHRTRKLREVIERRKANAKPHRVGRNAIRGGTAAERAAYLFEIAPGLFRSEYSESGAHCATRWALTNVSPGFRTDCSSWAQDVANAIGIPDPTGENYGSIFTGTVVAMCKQVDQAYAESHVGTAVLYGGGDSFHMGLSLGNGTSTTIEHGTPPLDYGHFDEFGLGTEVRYYRFLT
jgi:hypothetical protein